MNNQPMFDSNIGNITTSSSTAQSAALKVNDIANSSYFDAGKVLGATKDAYLKKNAIDVQIAKQEEATRLATEGNAAKVDYVNLVTSDAYLQAGDTDKANMFEEYFNTSIEKGDNYSNAFRGYAASKYAKVYEGRIKEDNDRVYQSTGVAYKAWSENVANTGKSPDQFILEYQGSFPNTNKAVMARSLMFSQYSEWLSLINHASTPNELTSALTEVAEDKEKFKSNFFLFNTSKQGKEYLTELATEERNLIQSKHNEFMYAAKGRIAEAETGDVPYLTPINKIENDFTTAYGKDPIVLNNKRQAYIKKHNVALTNYNYNMINPIGARSVNTPNNKEFTEQRTKLVVEDLAASWSAGNMRSFGQVADNEGIYSKDFGKVIIDTINTGSEKEVANSFNNLNLLMETASGNRALKNMLSSEEFNRILAIQGTQQALGNKYSDARTMIDKNLNNASEFKFDNDQFKKIYEYAKKIGDGEGASQFIKAANEINKYQPGLPISFYRKLATKFKPNLAKSGDGQVNTSYAPNPINDSSVMDIDVTQSLFNKKVNMQDGDRVTLLGDGYYIKFNPETWTFNQGNIGDVVEEANKKVVYNINKEKYLEELIAKGDNGILAKIEQDIGKGFEGVSRTIVDNLGSFVTESPGTILKALTAPVVKAWNKGWEKDKKSIQEALGLNFDAPFEATPMAKVLQKITVDKEYPEGMKPTDSPISIVDYLGRLTEEDSGVLSNIIQSSVEDVSKIAEERGIGVKIPEDHPALEEMSEAQKVAKEFSDIANKEKELLLKKGKEAINKLKDTLNNSDIASLVDAYTNIEGSIYHTDELGINTGPFGVVYHTDFNSGDTKLDKSVRAASIYNQKVAQSLGIDLQTATPEEYKKVASELLMKAKKDLSSAIPNWSKIESRGKALLLDFKYNGNTVAKKLGKALEAYQKDGTEKNLGRIIKELRRTVNGKVSKGMDNRPAKLLYKLKFLGDDPEKALKLARKYGLKLADSVL